MKNKNPSKIIQKLEKAWTKTDYLRLGQMISNAMHGENTDLYYIEDDELIALIEDHMKKHDAKMTKKS